MKNVFTYSAIIVMSVFLLGLMFYGFYIVLTSKDDKDKSERADDLSETELTVLQKKGKIIGGKPVTEPTKGKADAATPNPPQKPGKNPGSAKKRRAA